MWQYGEPELYLLYMPYIYYLIYVVVRAMMQLFNYSEIQFHQNLATKLDWGSSALFIINLFLVGPWLAKSYGNLQDNDTPGVTYSNFWTWGGFFVPIAAYFVPNTIARQTLNGYNFHIERNGKTIGEELTSTHIGVW